MSENMQPIPELKGYLSEQDKRRYTFKAGILGAVFFVAQFVVPFVIMLPLMFAGSWRGFERQRIDAGQAVWWKEKVWAVSTSGRFGAGGGDTRLISLEVGEDAEPVEVCELHDDDARLLPEDDRLWIITSGSVSCYSGGRMKNFPQERLGSISRPFLYDGRPAVVDMQPTEDVLKVFEADKWRTVRSVCLRRDEFSVYLPGELRIVSDGLTLHVFLEDKGTIYYRLGLPPVDETSEAEKDPWKPVAKVGHGWTALLLNGHPTVLHINQRDLDATIVGWRLRDGDWEQFFRHEIGQFVDDLNAFAIPGEDRFVLALGTLFDSLKILDVQSGEVIGQTGYGRGFPFPKGFMAIMFVPHAINLLLPLVLAIVLSTQMRRHRVQKYTTGMNTVPFASLTRRAVAQVIDAVIMGAPIVLGYILLFRNFENMFDPFQMLFSFGLIGVGFTWALALLFVFSFLEGKYGRTPGKWVAGIQVVGTDLRPCGFGRAIIRNLLKFVDGFFNFMVGILIVSLTENWQRIGDLASRTVVVRGPLPEDVSQSSVFPPPAPPV